MKNTKVNCFLILLQLTFLMASCTDAPNPCDLNSRTSHNIQEISNIRFKDLDLSIGKTKGLVIRNKEDFEKYLSPYENMPDIDFSKKVLLAGAIKSSSCITVEDQYFQTGCEKAYYRVEIIPLVCQAITTLEFFSVIDKELVPKDVEYEFIIKE